MLPTIISCILKVLASNVTGLRDEYLQAVKVSLALNKSSLQRLLCLQVVTQAMEMQFFSRPYFLELFSEILATFQRETNSAVIRKVCEVAPSLHCYTAFSPSKCDSPRVVFDLVDGLSKFLVKECKKLITGTKQYNLIQKSI